MPVARRTSVTRVALDTATRGCSAKSVRTNTMPVPASAGFSVTDDSTPSISPMPSTVAALESVRWLRAELNGGSLLEMMSVKGRWGGDSGAAEFGSEAVARFRLCRVPG